MKDIVIICLLFQIWFCWSSCKPAGTTGTSDETKDNFEMQFDQDSLILEGESHFSHLKQLTNGGDNAEAYWSFDNSMLVFQATNPDWEVPCDQIFVYDLKNTGEDQNSPKMVSTGMGRTTCSYFMPGDETVIYASTHETSSECPPVPERRPDGLYVWPIYDSYDIYEADLEGNILRKLTNEDGYDAEATLSPLGDKIVFTSMRTGDLELYTMDTDGGNVKQITDELGYDGGAFFSPDGQQIVFRASRPKTDEEITTYKSLLEEGLVQPTRMEIFVCDADGSNLRQITSLGNANWAPFFHPSGEQIIFSSNHKSMRGFPFNLFIIGVDGEGLKQVTFDETFDSFPMFSPDGRYLAFSSNRNNGGTRATNLFIAKWQD
jgi:Tol biopolymer transport system component